MIEDGPVVAVYRYRALQDAIRQANALPTAFQASIFAQDVDVAMQAADRLDASAVMINDPTAFRTDWMPVAANPAMAPETSLTPCATWHRKSKLAKSAGWTQSGH
ncbi:aldehyde dehydrogenase family protein [Nisaea sediminum]|uniref:aldehyde dehydrogenase family protein n=1 Tax=Nisaea sediminum TaxID=2775867 RepID=UPI0029C06072|nr:aldehyde dehydrogenase family protein [Nisaea sediminum]